MTQREVARLLQANGLEWSRDQVQFLEHGQREGLEVRDLVGLSAAFGVPVAYWLAGPGSAGPGGAPGRWVALSEQIQVELGWLAQLFSGRAHRGQGALAGFYGEPVGTTAEPPAETAEYGILMLDAPIDQEEFDAARRLGISPQAVRALGLRLWRMPLVWRRAVLLGPEAESLPTRTRAARRGHITRALLAEMREALREEDKE